MAGECSVREEILVLLEALMNSVSGVKLVTREFRPIDDISTTQFPAIIIEDDGAEDYAWKTGGFADVSFDINIIGYVNQQGGVSTALNNLDSEIKKIISSDLTLGGKVAIIRILPYTDRSGSKFAPYGYFERPLRITFEGHISGGL